MDHLQHGLQHSLREKFSFSSLTPIQEAAVDALLSGKQESEDVLISSPTGAGKSLSYMIPLMHSLLSQESLGSRNSGTFGIIVSPTRELSVQLCDVLTKLLNFPSRGGSTSRWIVPGTLLSGVSRSKEKARLRKGMTVVIATPGRLLDHLENTSSWSLANLKWIVVEEADRYLGDKALLESLDKIFRLVVETRRIPRSSWRLVLVSATLPKHLAAIGAIRLSPSPLVLRDKKDAPREGSPLLGPLSSRLVQWTLTTPTKLRLPALLSLLTDLKNHISQLDSSANTSTTAPFRLVLFVSTCDTVDFLFHLLSRWRPEEPKENEDGSFSKNEAWSGHFKMMLFRLHGSRDTVQRSQVIQSFRRDQGLHSSQLASLLITTNVGARGLDFPSLRLVIQWDAPLDPIDYVHKVGRTARFQSHGSSLCFLLPHEKTPIMEALGGDQLEIKDFPLSALLPDLLVNILDNSEEDHFSKKAISLFADVDRLLYANKAVELLEHAQKAFLASLRGYATYPSHLRLKGLHPKFLHLGHYAKSFGLREAPSKLGSISGKLQQRGKKDDQDATAPARKKLKSVTMKSSLLSEFSSGPMLQIGPPSPASRRENRPTWHI